VGETPVRQTCASGDRHATGRYGLASGNFDPSSSEGIIAFHHAAPTNPHRWIKAKSGPRRRSFEEPPTGFAVGGHSIDLMDMFQCTRQRQMHYRPRPAPIQRRERSPREVNMRMRDRYRPDGHQLRRPVERRPLFGAPETHEARAPPVRHSNAAMGSSHDVTAGVCSGAFGWLRGAPEHHLVSSPPAARGGTQCGAGARAPGTRRTEHR